jgi:hypothetical protein
MLNSQLKRLCEAILNDTVASQSFGDLLAEAGVSIDNLGEKEWDIANKLLVKSEEISHAAGGRENKIVH